MAKPATKPDWTVGNPDFATVTQEPTVQKKQDGWLPDERPPREYMNWLFFNIGEWIDYLETVSDALLLQLGQFDAVIGFGGTHSDINDLMADPDIANLKSILVTDQIAIDAIQIINQPGMTFYFKAQAYFIKGLSGTGIQIDAERITFQNARFLNFDVKAIVTTANAKNCIIQTCRFKDCAVTIDDALGVNNILANNVEEV